MRIMNMNELLTDDIVKVIFKKLPFSNLSICKVVCKAWNDLVLDYTLSSKFHHRNSLLICTYDVVPNPGSGGMSTCNPKMHSMDFGTNIINSVATYKFDGSWDYFLILSSCNGLLWIEEDMYRHGFGFSPNTKQYKLFRIYHHHDYVHDEPFGTFIEVWRFGISTESQQWKCIRWLPFQFHESTYLDGVIYWLAEVTQHEANLIANVQLTNEQRLYMIYSLDVETEKFDVSFIIDVGSYTNTDFSIHLKSFNGKVGVIVTMFEPIWKTHVWIMGAKYSWTKEFVIDIPIYEPSKLVFVEGSIDGISFLFNGDLYCFDKNGKIKIKIKTLPNTNENVIQDVHWLESFQFGSLAKILAGDY